MSKASFSNVIYIHATTEEVWNGLTNPEITSRYWFHEFVTDWEPGSDWAQKQLGPEGNVVVGGQILECERPNTLVLTWSPPNSDEEPSKVSFEISPVEEWPHGPWQGVQLVHSELEPDSEMLHSISFGWPAIMSGLKSVIERPDIFGSE